MTIYYTGRVQGVGFRYTVKSLSTSYEVTGVVRNMADGRVELIAEGDRPELELFQRAVQDSEVGGMVRHEDVEWGAATGEFRGYEIVG